MERPVDRLRPSDLIARPLWRFVSADNPDETSVVPLKSRRVASLAGKVVGAQVTFADGSRHWALLSNVDANAPRLTQHVLTLSVWIGRRWFHLARYHDVDAKQRGPRALATAAGRRVGAVFPIAYDLRPYVRGATAGLAGVVTAEPGERLTRAAIIAMAVP